MNLKSCLIVFALCFTYGYLTRALEVKRLGRYGADKYKVSVGGVSSGSFMSSQLHVAFSKDIMGVAMFAGGLYYCARGLNFLGVPKCLQAPLLTDVNKSINQVYEYASRGLVDPPSNLEGAKVYIFNGALDPLVNPNIGKQIQTFYQHFKSVIRKVLLFFATHSMPTESSSCKFNLVSNVSDCNYNGAYESLNFIYENQVKPTSNVQLTGDFYMFDQKEFINGSACRICMDKVGYVYVPTYCQTNKGCKVHVFNHGCLMLGPLLAMDQIVPNNDYNRVAELNNIIIIYPMMINCWTRPPNVFGCHDWVGSVDKYYATKNGPQMNAIFGMIKAVTSD